MPDHPFHVPAARALAPVRADGRVLAHVLAETYSSLTSSGIGLEPREAARYLGQFLDREPAWIRPARYPHALEELASLRIVGGAIYDGMIAIAARDAGLRLLSLDRRARPTYETCAVEFELLSEP